MEKKLIKNIRISFFCLVAVLLSSQIRATPIYDYCEAESVNKIQKPDSPPGWASFEKIQIATSTGVSLNKSSFDLLGSIQDLFQNTQKEDESIDFAWICVYDIRYTLKNQIFPFHSFW